MLILQPLSGASVHSTYADAVLLRALSIDARFRRHGVANPFLRAAAHLVLSVNAEDDVAAALYLASGFADAGRRLMGGKGHAVRF
ncbi:MAG: hypothetical protein ABF868_00995 [Sporolactobacillus sp.]